MDTLFFSFWPGWLNDDNGGSALVWSLLVLVLLVVLVVVSTGDVGCETFADAGRGFLTILCSVLVDSMLPLPVASCLWAFAEAAMASSEGVSRWM